MEFIKGYSDNKELRKSFNQLALETFGIEFETWFTHGFWTEKYVPYSFVDHSKVVANVSINMINLVVQNEMKQAVQIGTVMTAAEYRNQGLSRKLMEMVLNDYQNVDLIYLFANQTVLNFYPKFGFEAVEEVQFSMEYSHFPANPQVLRKLDGRNKKDLAFIYDFASKRCPISEKFATMETEELLMFYCIMVFPNDIYYMDDLQVIVVFQIDEDVLHLYDVISLGKVKINEILSRIASHHVKRVLFHYHEDDMDHEFEKIPVQSDVLFLKNISNINLPVFFKHPITSKA